MKTTNESTTMICLFHDPEQAEAAINDLVQAGLSKGSIGVMKNAGTAAANPAAMEKWKVPERDAQLLLDGINKGGIVVAVSAGSAVADKVEAIFGRRQAAQIDEVVDKPMTVKSSPSASVTSGGKIDIVEEEMTVGKREVQRGGVRVYQRIVEKPVTETVTLQEEHVKVERRPVDRAVSAADASAFEERSFEVTESGEEAVVSKTARVVEEVLVGKESTVHTETIKGTVRKTDVTVEKIEPGIESKATVKQ